MSTFVKLLSDLDGKILNIYSASQDNILFEKNSNKRIFNLIDKSSIIPFINDFNKFLISQNIYVKLTYSVYFNNSKTLSYIYIKKLNRHLLIKIKKINLTNSLIKKNKFLETLMFVVRFKFVIGSIMPFIFATFWSYCKYKEIVFLFLILMFMAIILLHMAANTFNDYFDWSSGRDVKNVDYLLASTGGSRAIDFNLISEKNMLLISWMFIFLALLIGLYITYCRGYEILIVGFTAFLCIYFYSAPPIHLASRYGLGELVHVFCLGPMIVYGTCLTLSGSADFTDFVIGFPFGILITACLLMNEYPDSKYDKISKKNNLAVVLSVKYIPYFFSALILLVYSVVFLFVQLNLIDKIFYITFIAFPYSINVAYSTFLIVKNRKFVVQACVKSFYLYIFFSILYILSVVLSNPW